jgi:hypothetical protein
MHPLAHHTGEDTLTPLLLLGGAWLSVLVAYGRERLATIRTKLSRKQEHRQGEGHRTPCFNRSDSPRSGHRQHSLRRLFSNRA